MKINNLNIILIIIILILASVLLYNFIFDEKQKYNFPNNQIKLKTKIDSLKNINNELVLEIDSINNVIVKLRSLDSVYNERLTKIREEYEKKIIIYGNASSSELDKYFTSHISNVDTIWE